MRLACIVPAIGRATDFGKRRIAGYIVFWLVVLFVVYTIYDGDRPTEATWVFVLAFAFTVSWAYTRRMKRKQREARAAQK